MVFSNIFTALSLSAFICAERDKGINNVMIVTDKGLMSLHFLDGLFKQLEEDGISYTLYDGVQPNPSIENIEEARAQFVANGCQAKMCIRDRSLTAQLQSRIFSPVYRAFSALP